MEKENGAKGETMKVVFLDIDGVLNSQRSCIAFGGYPHETTGFHRDMFDEVALRLIRGIVKQAGASVVLSSSWRITNRWQDVAKDLELPIIDQTPVLWTGGRGAEIEAWLAAHPEVESYAIVDDDSDMLDEQRPFFVQTSNFDGFLWQDAHKLAGLLGVNLYDVNREPSLAWAT